MRAYIKDTFRTIIKNIKRLTAIAVMVMLGVALFVGIPAACDSAFESADRFYKQTGLFDIRVVSTLGLTIDDVNTIYKIEGVRSVYAGFSDSVKTEIRNKKIAVSVIMLDDNGMNNPLTLEGNLPQKGGEIAVERGYLRSSGKQIGDTLLLLKEAKNEKKDDKPDDDNFGITIDSKNNDPVLAYDSYVITASVLSPLRTTSAFNDNTGSNAYLFYVNRESVVTDIFTDIYLNVDGTDKLNCYENAYLSGVEKVAERIGEEVKTERAEARYKEITDEAFSRIAEAGAELQNKKAEAEIELRDADIKLSEARQEIIDGEEEIRDGWKEIATNQKKLEDALTDIVEGEAKLSRAKEKLVAGQKDYDNGMSKFKSQAKQLNELWQGVEAMPVMINYLENMLLGPVDEAEFTMTAYGVIQTAEGSAVIIMKESEDFASDISGHTTNAIEALASGEWEMAYHALCQLNLAAITDAVENARQQLETGRVMLDDAKKALDEGWAALSAGEAELEQGRKEIDDGFRKLQTARTKLNDAEEEISDAKIQLTDGERELAENKAEYYEKIAEAERKLTDAKTEVDKISYPKWYILDRTSIDSYERLKNDVNSIKAVGSAFPIIFLIVAAAVCLTSMTRLVEEERSIAGTYMAIGYSRAVISVKYIVFAILACFIGGALGGAAGFLFFPAAIWSILMKLHNLPELSAGADMSYLLIGVLSYTAVLVTATIIACRKELKSKPSQLMRPKPPASGGRILLERITPLWNRMKFLSKVTARNLFRYKKRMFMTIFGITGCTALIVTGFALKNSALGLVSSQYDTVTMYDMIAVFDADNNSAYDELTKMMREETQIKSSIPVTIEGVTIINESGDNLGIQMILAQDANEFSNYVNLINDDSGKVLLLADDGITLTENAAKILNVKAGDRVILKNSDNEEKETAVYAVVHNYLGNYIYTTKTYGNALGLDAKINAFFINTAEKISEEDRAELRQSLINNKNLLSVTNVDSIRRDFTESMAIVDMVVYILIAMAACLAFVVLYTLANINISERRRELATIKVLGFYDRETFRYVNHETVILAVTGILLGLPAGRGIGEFIVSTIKMPSISIHIDILPISYLTAAILTLAFTLITNIFSNRVLKKLNMIESLKSVE